MHSKKIRFGVLGIANILAKSLIQPSHLNCNVDIFAVASRKKSHALKFAMTNKIANVYSNYEKLLECEEIDAIYIPLPNSMHSEYIIKAAKQGKHVLVEKPICIKSSDFTAIKEAALVNNVQILEALMVQHHPWMEKVKEIVNSGKYGRVKKAETVFNLELNQIHPLGYRYFPVLGGGVFYDLSPYWLVFLQNCLGLSPVKISAFSKFDGPNNVDMDFEACLNYENGEEALFFASFRKPFAANHTIIFENATLIVRTFIRPAFGDFPMTIKIIVDKDVVENIKFPPQNYYQNQLNFFIEMLNNEKENIPLNQSFERIRIMEQVYEKSLQNKLSHDND